MDRRTAKKWTEVLTACGVKPATAARWAPIFSVGIGPGVFSAGTGELDDFLGQVLHESAMLERVEESLNYTRVERLCEVWPSRFKTAADATACVRNPQALANKVYGGRMGNSLPGDGWRYRGRGLVQVTGRDNYAMVSRAIGVDLVTDPDKLSQPATALAASIAWWEGRIPDSAMGDVRRVTKLVNGGAAGLDERVALTAKAAKALA